MLQSLVLSFTIKNFYSRLQKTADSVKRSLRIMMKNRQTVFLYSLVMDTYSVSGYSAAPFLDMPLNHKVFLAQFETIKKIAEKESCVIVGRCADYALSDNPDCINVFIHADLDVRIKNVSRNLNITENKARDIINKTDKQRASYYNYYTSKKWGDSKSYNLSLDAGKLGTDNCVEMILKFRELMDAMK